MKAVTLHGFTYNQLRLEERPEPAVGPRDIKIRVRAASINFRDRLIIGGQYGIPADALPLVPLSDGAGEVVEVGRLVSQLHVGDRVTTMMTRDWDGGALTPMRFAAQNGGPLDGVLQEFVVLHERAVVPFPPHLSYEEASTLPIAAVTAWSALTEGGVGPDKTVLILGTGNVSLFGLQLAKAAGARVIATTSREDRIPSLMTAGADIALNYQTHPDWPNAVVEATEGRGADIVIEVAGLQNIDKSLAALRHGGYVGVVGFLAGLGAPPDFTFSLLYKNARLRGVITGSRDTYEDMNRVLTNHRIRPVIDKVFDFADFREALAHYDSGRAFGKVVVRL